MATRSQPHGTRWLEIGSIQMIKAVCTVSTVTKEIALSALCQCPNRGDGINPLRLALFNTRMLLTHVSETAFLELELNH